ncbi:MAG: imidazole glycerol phosphate synthase subunit HisH, partial [Thaumarchaeota archaeon]|nr:imidazole glycerol phosphate synthase subunit HisH [Nitrososphaerota archaeon]
PDVLGVFSGKVIRFQSKKNTKVPHMGWNTLEVSRHSSKLCSKISSGEWVYFVHSYFPEPESRKIVSAWTSYAGKRFASVVESGNVFGTQFHPEKSHSTGAKLLANYVRAMKANSKR